MRFGIAQVTKGGIDEKLAQRIIERIPTEFMVRGWAAFTADETFAEDSSLSTVPCCSPSTRGV